MTGDPRAGDAPIAIGLGGNVGGEQAVLERFRAAVAALHERLPVASIRVSAVYSSAPVGPVAHQPRFLNAVAVLRLGGAVTPLELMSELLAIEAELGRTRRGAVPQGPRTLDLDLLFHGDAVLDEAGPPRLVLPHPRICQRAFVLRPLAELMGEDWRLPGIGRTVAECLADPAVAAQLRSMSVYAQTL